MQALLVSEDDRLALHDPRQHLESLTRLSIERLAGGDAFAAFIYADRRCRLAAPRADDFVLRSEALQRLGLKNSATADLLRANALDPTSLLVNQRLIEAGGEETGDAARWVVSDPRSSQPLLDAATRALLDRGCPAVGSITVDANRLTGWIAWADTRPVTLRVETEGGAHDVPMTAMPEASEGRVPPRVRLALRLESPFVRFFLLIDGEVCDEAFCSLRLNPVAEQHPVALTGGHRDEEREPETGPSRRRVTIIVPVYDDVEVTRRCLEAVAAQEADDVELRVLLVNDASPAPAMAPLLAEAASRPGFDLIVNDRNLGFIGAVNRALAEVTAGDVVFLNSDVVLPPGAIRKLAAAAARPGVGIVNPLTNNGQFNSFPSVRQDNAFGDERRIAEIDRAAEEVAPGLIVETPGGIGYCMYVTRACLDAVGPIPEVYLRGYYEDVEFCLRAKERGFDTVCAVDCYVGHKGTASFKGEKQRLVSRNERVNDLRFPRHGPRVRAFRRADPLGPSRAAIEALAFPLGTADVVVAGSAVYAGVLQTRAKALEKAGSSAIRLAWSVANGTLGVRLQRSDEAEPRQRVFRLDGPESRADLEKEVLALQPRRIELAGSPGAFAPVLDALLQGGLDFGVLLCESLGQSAVLERGCLRLDEAEPCSTCVENFDLNWRPHGIGHKLFRAWEQQRGEPKLFVPMDAMSHELATDLAGDAFQGSRFEPFVPAAPPRPRATASFRSMLALPYPEPSLATERLLAVLAATLLRRSDGWQLVLLGGGLDDRRLMSTGNVFVSGPVGNEDYEEALLHYGAARLFAPQRWSGYGLIARLAETTMLPKAYFDWSIDALPAMAGDLSIDPRVCDAKAAQAVAGWLGASIAGQRHVD